ncbi:sigma factor [Streptomyces sp. S1]|uniref:sigma factor n=1 Tax=Streptomyces sp. S1 TaxID=718288 RepID=UPI003D7315B3
MLGSYAGTEDAVRETMVRAWRSVERFEGRSPLRSWVYRIATDVCLGALAAGRRRALSMDFSVSAPSATPSSCSRSSVCPHASTWTPAPPAPPPARPDPPSEGPE